LLSDRFPANRTQRNLLRAGFTAAHVLAGLKNDVTGSGKANFALLPCFYLSACVPLPLLALFPQGCSQSFPSQKGNSAA